jgi:hypothetical protein
MSWFLVMKGFIVTFAVHLHNHHLVNKVPKDRIREIIVDALNIEREFITESFQFFNRNERRIDDTVLRVCSGSFISRIRLR